MKLTEYNEDQKKLLNLLKSKNKVFLMIAPSFPIDFEYESFVRKMKKLGFDKVTELTFGAKIVNKEYREYINNHPEQKMFIASVCPTIVTLITSQFPEYKKYLLPFESPMTISAKIVHKHYPNHKIVFLSPCFAKKIEAKKTKIIDLVITFKEMRQILDNENPKVSGKRIPFNAFYNEYTKIYPLIGGLADTMNAHNIFKKSEIISCDDCKDMKKVLKQFEGKKFLDLLFCKGGCIGGPGILSQESTQKKKEKIIEYKRISEREVIGKRRGVHKLVEGMNFEAKF